MSRDTTGQLHRARPQFLQKVAIGIGLILLSFTLGVTWTLLHSQISLTGYLNFLIGSGTWDFDIFQAGYHLAAILLLVGVCLTTAHEPNRREKRSTVILRHVLRILAWLPLMLQGLNHYIYRYHAQLYFSGSRLPELIPAALEVSVFVLSVVWLIYLSHIARRAGSDRVAEHCWILSIGSTLIYPLVMLSVAIIRKPESFGLVDRPAKDGTLLFALCVFGPVAVSLFWLWMGYIITHFSIRCWLEARKQQILFRAADMARQTAPQSITAG